MNNIEEYCPVDKKDWRVWLEHHHESKQAVWVIFYKKSSINFNLSWSDAVDEALCFGWIDSTKRSLDKERFIQYFSKRKPTSTWSKVNKDKVAILIAENKMHAAGMLSIKVAKKNGSWSILDSVEALELPENLKAELTKRAGAMEFYQSLSKSDKKILLGWIVLAKRQETKEKRILEIAENASLQKKPKPFM